MTDPFAAALAAQFRAPGSAAATYTPAGAPPIPLRLIREQGTAELVRNGKPVLLDTDVVRIQRVDVAEPLDGDALAIGADLFTVQGGARLDVEGLTWTVALEPA